MQVGKTGGKSWVFMWTRGKKRTVPGLGPYPAVSLAEAREKAAVCRKQLAAGKNPLTERRKKATPTFREAVKHFLDEQRLATWRNAKHRDQWRTTLGEAYCKAILDKRVDEIGTAEVLAVLKPIWQEKAATASRLRGRLERVLAFCEAQGWRPEGKNPAQWRGGLDAILPPSRRLIRGHHRALPYAAMPALMARLKPTVGVAARALEFIALTAVRSGEAVNATWAEIDVESRLWTIPATRTKAGRPHRVPLSPAALAVLDVMAAERRSGSDWVFPGQARGRPITSGAVEMLLRRLGMKSVMTVHGLRSTFRDWCGDATDFARETAEQALGHVVGSAVERAYRRGDALDKRRKLMDAWAHYCCAGSNAKVVSIASKVGR